MGLTARQSKMGSALVAALVLLCLGWFSPVSARGAVPATLENGADAASPATSDGTAYVVWMRADGRAEVLNTRTGRRRATARLCDPSDGSQRVLEPTASFGVAVVGCQVRDTAVTRQWTVKLSSATAHPLTLPDQPSQINVIGRYWMQGTAAPGGERINVLYIERSTGRRTVAAGLPPVVGDVGTVLDLDDRQLRPLRTPITVLRLSLSGAPSSASGVNNLLVRDGRSSRTSVIERPCRDRCAQPFGRSDRLTYVRYTLAEPLVVLRRRGLPTRTFAARTTVPPTRQDPERLVQPVLTRHALVISEFRRRWRISRLRLKTADRR